MSMIGGCSKIVQDVPPFMIVDGNPGETRTINKVGMERNGISEDAQNALRSAYKILFREGLTIPNALSKIEGELPPLPEIKHLVQFIRTSERASASNLVCWGERLSRRLVRHNLGDGGSLAKADSREPEGRARHSVRAVFGIWTGGGHPPSCFRE